MKRYLSIALAVPTLSSCGIGRKPEMTMTTYPIECDGYIGSLGRKAKFKFDGKILELTTAEPTGWFTSTY